MFMVMDLGITTTTVNWVSESKQVKCVKRGVAAIIE